MNPCPSFLSHYRGLVCLAFCLLLTACTNTDPTTGTTQVAGQVVLQQSQQPVGGGTVQVYVASSAGGYRPVGDPQPCDPQGRFSFDFDTEKNGTYLLLAQAPPGYMTDWAVAPRLTAGRANKGLVVPVLAPAWVRLVLVDEPPKSRVTMTITGYSGSGEQLLYPQDVVLVRPLLAGFKTNITWFVYDQDDPKRDFKSYQEIQPQALDTVTVRIPF
jgi:hypothetical protein